MKKSSLSVPDPRKDLPDVLPLDGEIDLHVSPAVAETLRTMTDRKPAHLTVDLSHVTYMDSSGLAVLIEAMQNVQKYGGKFAVTGLNSDVMTIFEIARLD